MARHLMIDESLSAEGEGEEVSPAPERHRPSLFLRLIGVLGEILITLGVVVGLFVIWQIWWTDILANRDQVKRIAVATQEWEPAGPQIGAPRTDPPPTIDHNETAGNIEGIMRIPSFGKDYAHTIEYGTGLESVLDTGAFGHYEGSGWPGEVGNYALAAHRQTYGAALKHVDQLKTGDAVIVETSQAYLIYYVYDSYIVSPGDTDVVEPVPNQLGAVPTESLLTLTTCHPPFVSNERWIIHAKYDHWVARSDGIPAELAE